MASTLTKMTGSISEFKKFLEENNNEYYQAYDILPGLDPIEGQICWQFRNITDNLYEVRGLESLLKEDSTATDEEILFLFNGILVELQKLPPFLKETFKKSDENPFYSNAVTINNLAAKTSIKLKEVIAIGKEDIKIGNSQAVADAGLQKPILINNAVVETHKLASTSKETSILEKLIPLQNKVDALEKALNDPTRGEAVEKYMPIKHFLKLWEISDTTFGKVRKQYGFIPESNKGGIKRLYTEDCIKAWKQYQPVTPVFTKKGKAAAIKQPSVVS